MYDRLKVLYKLQQIDNQLDELEDLRGDLPNLVRELEEKIAGFVSDIETKEKIEYFESVREAAKSLDGTTNQEKRICKCGKSRPNYNYKGLEPEYCSKCKKNEQIFGSISL